MKSIFAHNFCLEIKELMELSIPKTSESVQTKILAIHFQEFCVNSSILSFKGKFLEFRMYHNFFSNLFSKLSESTFYKEKS